MTQKIIVNRGYGGFSIADDVVTLMREELNCEVAQDLTLPGESYDDGSERDANDFRDCCYPRDDEMARDHECLVEAVERGWTNDLSVCEVPSDVKWVITEYDGAETVREKHRTFPSGDLAKGIARSYEVQD
jgi:hypothetical protein